MTLLSEQFITHYSLLPCREHILVIATLPLRVGVEQVAEALHVPVLLPRLP